MTTFEFHLPLKSTVSLKIYDASGKLLLTLKDGEMGPGVYKVLWDGKNSSGSRVTSGVYFCRLVLNNEESFTRKIVMLR
ncbi:MAG: T9SS type A sorting domain-containing protein [Candidatus Krumholzibacteriota bacterium]|nr:T9SS type A sorting domain-containing protein [Candidatus Krumholzibacteriota bacterium]